MFCTLMRFCAKCDVGVSEFGVVFIWVLAHARGRLIQWTSCWEMRRRSRADSARRPASMAGMARAVGRDRICTGFLRAHERRARFVSRLVPFPSKTQLVDAMRLFRPIFGHSRLAFVFGRRAARSPVVNPAGRLWRLWHCRWREISTSSKPLLVIALLRLSVDAKLVPPRNTASSIARLRATLPTSEIVCAFEFRWKSADGVARPS